MNTNEQVCFNDSITDKKNTETLRQQQDPDP